MRRSLVDSGLAGAERFEEWGELHEQLGRGSETELESRIASDEIADLCAGFSCDQCTRGVVPGLQTALVISIDTATGH